MGEGTSLWLAVAAVIVLYWLMRRASASRGGDGSERASSAARYQIPRLARLRTVHAPFSTLQDASHETAQPQEAPPDLVRWQVEMHELARDLKAEIDTKLVALQTLIAMARQEAARLESLLAKAVPPPSSADASEVSLAQAPTPGNVVATPQGVEGAEATDLGPTDALTRLTELADPAALADPSSLARAAASLKRESGTGPSAHDALQLKIARLADQGCPAEEIAGRLGLPLGEVELRLSLRSREA